MFTAADASRNVKNFKKNFGTSNVQLLLNCIEELSIQGKSSLQLSALSTVDHITGINKKDYYLLRQRGFNIQFSATYEKNKVNKYYTVIKTRDISLLEYFNSADLEDKVVTITW
jgi:hypothetical protein